MFLSLKIESVSMSSNWSDKSFKDPAPDTTSVGMSVVPSGRDHIELSTGEVFRHPRKHFGGDDKSNIPASVYIVTPRDPTHKSRMIYFEAHQSRFGDLDSDASIHFEIAIEAAALAELLTNIRAGLFPTILLIEFPHSIFEEGPLSYLGIDGSGIGWDTSASEKCYVQIKAVRFSYEILKPASAPDSIEARDDTERLVLIQEGAAADNADSKALLAAVGDINTNLKRLIKVLAVIVAAALGVSYKFW
jgi:hypothetical protein